MSSEIQISTVDDDAWMSALLLHRSSCSHVISKILTRKKVYRILKTLAPIAYFLSYPCPYLSTRIAARGFVEDQTACCQICTQWQPTSWIRSRGRRRRCQSPASESSVLSSSWKLCPSRQNTSFCRRQSFISMFSKSKWCLLLHVDSLRLNTILCYNCSIS